VVLGIKMNGLNLAQLPAQNQLGNIDPLNILEDQYNRAIQQLNVNFDQQRQLVIRKPDNQINILKQQYDIEVNALRRKFESVPKSQRGVEFLQRTRNELNGLNKKYAMREAQIRGKVRPDLQDLEAVKQQQLQQLQIQRAEKIIRFNNIKELVEKGIITDPYAALKEQYEIVGYNIPTSEFQPRSFREIARENIAQAFHAMEKGDKSGAQAILQQNEGILAQLPPDEATAFRKSARLSTLELRRKKRGPEEPGTFAEKVAEAKPKPSVAGRFGTPLSAKQKPIYQRNKTTGETRVSYDGGRTWQTTG